jgi:hypothetical protein
MKPLRTRINAFIRGYKDGMRGYSEAPSVNQTSDGVVKRDCGASPLSNGDMYGTDVCPKCQSVNIGEASTLALRKSQIKDLPSFTILGYQMCHDCNHIWERRVPLWSWYTGLVIGLVGFGLFSLWLTVQYRWNLLFFLLLSGAIIIGSVRGIMREKRRKPPK